jgi:hypothetical protein
LVYHITVFEKDGTNILNDSFEAKDDKEAKEIGTKILKEKGYLDYTHRCVAPDGHLVLFHR